MYTVIVYRLYYYYITIFLLRGYETQKCMFISFKDANAITEILMCRLTGVLCFTGRETPLSFF